MVGKYLPNKQHSFFDKRSTNEDLAWCGADDPVSKQTANDLDVSVVGHYYLYDLYNFAVNHV